MGGEAKAYRRRLAEEEALAIRAGGERAAGFASFGAGSVIEGPQRRILGEHAIRVGAGVTVLKHVCLEAYAPAGSVVIDVGDGCYLSYGARIVALNGVRVGAGTTFGSNVTLTDTIHDYRSHDGAFWEAPLKEGRALDIGERVLLGVNVVVTGGIVIGDGAIVGPNAVITRDVPPGSMVQGNPAQIVKRLREDGSWAALDEPRPL